MTEPVINRVATLDLTYEPWDWPFATRRRADIDAHFDLKKREKPNIWNGRVLLARRPACVGGQAKAHELHEAGAAKRDRGGSRRPAH